MRQLPERCESCKKDAYDGADPATKEALAARLDSLRGCEGKRYRRAEDGD